MNNKARVHKNPRLAKIISDIPELDKRKIAGRMSLAARIDDLRKASGFRSKTAFARAVNKHESVITKWLSGTHNFTADTLEEISEALGVPIGAFFSHDTQLINQGSSAYVVAEAKSTYASKEFKRSKADGKALSGAFQQYATHITLEDASRSD